MKEVIARPGAAAYFRGMAMLARLFVMIALALIPFGMTGGGTAAAIPHEATMADHCAGTRGESERPPGPGPGAECTAACAALPALQNGAVHPSAPVAKAPRVSLSESENGLGPETATPPPRRS